MSNLNSLATRRGPRGFVLISSLLLLVVVTLLALAMFRGFGLEEKIGGNVREKARALQSAESAEQYAEWWLSNGNNAVANVAACSTLMTAAPTSGTVCTNQLAATVGNVAQVPWAFNGALIGVTYTPAGMTVSQAGGATAFYAPPAYYIALVGTAADGIGTIYRIDTVGYGGSPDAIAVVESTYEVKPGVQDLTQQ